jgi:amidohydrolase
MCEDGVMEGVDAIIGAHIDPDYPLGTIALNYGCMSASSHGFFLDFYGKACHVSTPHLGVDAIAMACRAFTDIQIMRARELNPKEPVVIGIGEFHGGSANNVVCDHVHLHGTIRSTSNKTDDYIYRRIGEIANSVGFEDQLYFSRVFKKVKGVPPSHYEEELSINDVSVNS